MPRRGLGDGVVLLSLGEEGAGLEEALEAAGELSRPAVEVVGSHLVDRDEDDERRLGPGGLLGNGRRRRAGGEEDDRGV